MRPIMAYGTLESGLAPVVTDDRADVLARALCKASLNICVTWFVVYTEVSARGRL